MPRRNKQRVDNIICFNVRTPKTDLKPARVLTSAFDSELTFVYLLGAGKYLSSRVLSVQCYTLFMLDGYAIS